MFDNGHLKFLLNSFFPKIRVIGVNILLPKIDVKVLRKNYGNLIHRQNLEFCCFKKRITNHPFSLVAKIIANFYIYMIALGKCELYFNFNNSRKIHL